MQYRSLRDHVLACVRLVVPWALLWIAVGVLWAKEQTLHEETFGDWAFGVGGVAALAGICWLIALHVQVKRRTRELSASERRFRAIFQEAKDAILLSDNDLNIVDANRATEDMLGYTRDELLAMNVKDLVASTNREKLDSSLLRANNREHVELEIDMLNKEGGTVDALATIGPIEADPSLSLLFVVHDITERKRAQEAIDTERKQLLSIFDSIDEAIYVTDPNTHEILYVNRTLRNQLGDVTGQKCYKTFQGLDGPCEFCTNDRIFGENIGKTYIWEFQNKLNERWYRCIDKALRWPDGRMVRCEVAIDITERKRLEEQLIQSQKMEAVGRLAGGVAHDFNNLLTAIGGYSQLLMQSAKDDKVRGDAEQIKKAADRAAELTQQLLAFSRRQMLRPEILDLNALVAEMAKLLPRILGEDVRLAVDLAPDLNRVKVDPAQIHQVIVNLAVNARDAMPRGGCLTIQTKNIELDEKSTTAHLHVAPGSYVMLIMTDTGCGMDAQTLSQAFDPFFTTKPKGQGTGLGLSTAYGIIKQSGGYIWATSTPGEGTTFEILLPATAEAAKAPTSPARPAKTAPGAETILLVEDEDSVLKLAQRILRQNGYAVLAAATGEEALRKYARYEGNIDLLLTDVVLPGMDGHEMAKHLTFHHPRMRVLYMSGYTRNAVANHGVLEEDISFIHKPFSPSELLGKVREVLDAGSSAD